MTESLAAVGRELAGGACVPGRDAAARSEGELGIDDLSGKIALITGGAGGIGAALAREFAVNGALVAIADLDLGRATDIAAGLGPRQAALPIHLDVTDEGSWRAARAAVETELGPVDILCCNAGVNFPGSLEQISAQAWRWVYEVNVLGTLHAIQTFLPGMKARGREGHVQLTCSITALRPFALSAAYTSSKAALLNMASVLSLELEGTRVGVSVACPGVVETDLRLNAIRTRPTALRDSPASSLSAALGFGMSPAAVARAMVQAVRDNRFFVFTHADYREAIAADAALMLAGMEQSADPDYREPAAMVAPIRRSIGSPLN